MAEVKNAHNAAKPNEAKVETKVEKSAEQLIAEAELLKKEHEAKKSKQNETIANWTKRIAEAHAKRKKYEGDDEDVIFAREGLMKGLPHVWKNIQEDPEIFEQELKDYKLSILTPEQREISSKINSCNEAIASSNKELADLRAKWAVIYPEMFGAIAAPRAPKQKGDTATKGENKPFTGVLNSKEVDTQKVKDLVAAGITSESAIIQAIYGNYFTITDSTPRFQIHSIRLALNMVPKKG